jgi:hypothetical protein
MDEIETLNNPEKSSWPFSEEWTKAWKQLEEQVFSAVFAYTPGESIPVRKRS